MCNSIICEYSFSIKYVPGQYQTEQICDKVVNNFLAALIFVSDWFVTDKIIKKPFTDTHPHENILYFNEDSSNVVFNCNEIGALKVNLNNINLNDAY